MGLLHRRPSRRRPVRQDGPVTERGGPVGQLHSVAGSDRTDRRAVVDRGEAPGRKVTPSQCRCSSGSPQPDPNDLQHPATMSTRSTTPGAGTSRSGSGCRPLRIRGSPALRAPHVSANHGPQRSTTVTTTGLRHRDDSRSARRTRPTFLCKAVVSRRLGDPQWGRSDVMLARPWS